MSKFNQNFSIAGIGRMGTVHLEAAIRSNLTPKVVFDTDSQKARDALSTLGLSDVLVASDIKEFARLSSGDLVTIATTSPAHLELIRLVAESGSSMIVCEKPLVNSLEEILVLRGLVEKYNLQIAVNHQMRYLEQYTKIREWQDEYGLGQMTTMSVSAANFGLGMNGTHYFEAFRWLTNEQIIQITGWVHTQSTPNVRGSQFFDYAGTLIGFNPSGAKLFIDFPEKAGHQVVVVYTFEFGKITVNELLGEAIINVRSQEFFELPSTRYGSPDSRFEKRFASINLVDSTSLIYSNLIHGGDYPTWEDGAYAVQCSMAAILSSNEGGKPIDVASSSLDDLGLLTWP